MIQGNIALVKSAYDAFQRGDIDAVLEAFDRDIKWFSPGPAELPHAGARSGHTAVRQFFEALNDMLDIERFEPKEFLAVDDKVIVIGEDTSRVKATGAVVEGQWAHVMTIQDGKVARFHEYTDTSGILAALTKAAAA
jgi:uncharacterized protein